MKWGGGGVCVCLSRTPAVRIHMYVLGGFFLWIDSNTGDGRGSPNDLHIMVVECGTELVLCDASRLTEGDRYLG